MKKFICIAVAFMLMGCFATTTPEQRKDTYDLRKNVGNMAFVGEPDPFDKRDLMMKFGAW